MKIMIFFGSKTIFLTIVRIDGRGYSPLKNCFVLTPSNTEFPPLPPPRIKTELEDKETRQESESIILRSSKNQTDLIRTPRTMKRPPSTTEVSSTRSKSNIDIRRPTKYDSPIKPPPTKKNKVKPILIPAAPVGINRNVQQANVHVKLQDTHVLTVNLIAVKIVPDQKLSSSIYLYVRFLLQDLRRKSSKKI